MKLNILTEGLFKDDLAGLILPLVSINEYESKVEKDAVVLTFFSKNPDAADDLSVFIEKSSIPEILDAEVSSAPDENGDYLVFVELENKNVISIILEVLRIVNHVCNVKEWKFQAYKLPRTYTLSKNNLVAYFNKMKHV